MGRATRYLNGEASISGLWDRIPPETPPGYQGRHAGIEDVSTGETLADQIASDIRLYRNSGVFARESDGAIVLLISATT